MNRAGYQKNYHVTYYYLLAKTIIIQLNFYKLNTQYEHNNSEVIRILRARKNN